MTETILSTPPVSLSSLFDSTQALFMQAELALSKEQFDLAEYFFQAAHNKDPENNQLTLNEAKIWHAHAKILENPMAFGKAYSKYKTCFFDESVGVVSHIGAINLKLDAFFALNNIGDVYDALRLIKRLEKWNQADNLSLIKAQLLYFKGKHYKDTMLLYEARMLLTKLHKQSPDAKTARLLANLYLDIQDLTQDIGIFINAISYRKIALELDPDNLSLHLELAQDYRALYFATLNQIHIQNFHDTCQLASILYPEATQLYLSWSEGLIDMGIDADNTDFVKLGIEKSHEAFTRTASSLTIDLLVSRGFSFLGKKLDRLSHIQDAFEKIKNYDEDPTNERLVISCIDMLIAFGQYFLDVDYYYQAIEKLQESLSIDSSKRSYWIKMAQTYLDISMLDQNPQTLELALRMIDKALSFYQSPESLLLKASILARLGELKGSSEMLDEAIEYFETALKIYPQLFEPKLSHLFDYARALDVCANYHEDESLYMKALDYLSHIIMVDPQYPELHHQIALTQYHLGELSLNPEIIKKSLIHFKLAAQKTANDSLYIDWAIACLTLSEMVDTAHEAAFLQHETANKLKKALKQGQVQAYYFMACLCTVCEDHEKAMAFLKVAERHEALPSHEDLLADEWLSPLHTHQEFIKLVERQEMKRP